MGWTFGWRTRGGLVAELLRLGDGQKLIDHEEVGDELWMVIELSGGMKVIELCLLECHLGQWGYKAMGEFVHPFYYDCPVRFFKLAPVRCQEWRDKVVAHQGAEVTA